MKTKFKQLLTLAVFMLICATLTDVSAQRKVGGYKSASVSDESVIEAAEFAVMTQGKNEDTEFTLDSVLKAETQVVAGTNFRLCLDVLASDADEDAVYNQQVVVIVFRNLKKEFSLTSWTEEECSEEVKESNNELL